MGIDKAAASPGIYEVLVTVADVRGAVRTTRFGDVQPANSGLAGAGIELVSMEDREFVLKKALEPLRSDYDYILIDCPPSLEMLTLNALTAAGFRADPCPMRVLRAGGTQRSDADHPLDKAELNPDITVEGVLLTMYDSRTISPPRWRRR
jgi:chromosome partitioning protein